MDGQKVAEKLVPSLNSDAPEAGYPASPGRQFTYVHDKATGPWQVVIKVDGDYLLVSGYGEDLTNSLATKSIKVSRY